MTPALKQNDHELSELAPASDVLYWAEPRNLELQASYRLENVFLTEPAQSKVEIVLYSFRSTTPSDISGQRRQQPVLVAHPQVLRTLLSGDDARSCSRIMMIHRLNSWSRIDVTADMFQAICDLDKVMPCFLKIVRGFAKKSRSHDENFMACYSQLHLSSRPRSCMNSDCTTPMPQGTKEGISSICYNIRYFERHGRALDDPWSCRQSAIHVKVSISTRKASSVIVQAPEEFHKEVSTVLDENHVHPLHIHLIYLSISLKTWRDYLNHIADRLRDLELEVSICKPYGEFGFSLSSKQYIHTLRHKLYHAQCILTNTLDTIRAIRAYAKKISALCDLPSTMQQAFEIRLENQANELRNHSRYDDILKSYQQELLHKNGVHLATIAQSDSAETKFMASISDKTYQDSRTMRIATLIAMLYLPANLVLLAVVSYAINNRGFRYSLNVEFLPVIWDAARDIIGTGDIIHGDIKPENVLVFEDVPGHYTVRVADFGYSTLYGSESHPLKLPISLPWNAPEHDRSAKEWNPAQAKVTDIYSFGLVSFWLMFHPWLRRDRPEAQDKRDTSVAVATGTMNVNETALDRLIMLKESGEIRTQSQLLVYSEASLSERYQTALKDFFATSLSLDPGEREASLRSLDPGDRKPILQSSCSGDCVEVEHGFVNSQENGVRENWLLNLSNTPPSLNVKLPQRPLRSSDFKLGRSLCDFYRSDFRVRRHIAAQIIDEHVRTGNLGAQAAVCHHIGFGNRRNEEKTLNILNRCEGSRRSFQPNLAGEWQDQGILEEAETQLEQEMEDLDASLSTYHTLILLSRMILSTVYRFRGRWKDAERLAANVIKIREVQVGENHADTFVAMAHMATLSQGQERWRDAEALLRDIVQRSRHSLGIEHADTLTYQLRLAWVHIQRNRLQDADELTRTVLLTLKNVFGEEHPKTLAAMDILCCVLRGQENHRDAVNLGRRLFKLSSGSMGTAHPITQQAMSNLATALWHEGLFDEAEELEILLLNALTESMGPDHPTTIIAEENLAGTLWSKGRKQKAEELERVALEKSIRVLGVADPKTYGIAANLATELAHGARWGEAQQLALLILNDEAAVQGPQTRDDLNAKLMLVNILFVSGNRPKSVAVLSQILKEIVQHSGPDDPEVCYLQLVLEKWREGAPVREAMLIFSDSMDFPIPPPAQG
ncbi:hypothetical protein J7T55_007246 [Diaporthe amygdali]|uniref:uncharacterized protein n=1 Tax=Phomopsis amygdali TaxID=1214568 RepID=UPI0022FEACC5|nr:uncharacterized protein J7T55_007246 [Diaporthe amygdali]KAJ0108127.1 hypothetical protein J7T55_007246 [Diaporthe amygdali]